MPALEFNLKAHATITGHNDPASLGLKPRLADHRSQVACTAMLPIAPPRQASGAVRNSQFLTRLLTSVEEDTERVYSC